MTFFTLQITQFLTISQQNTAHYHHQTKSASASLFCNLLLYLFFIFVFITGIAIINVSCTIPEASHEGALHPFKSYQDVLVFHYSLPRHILGASWQFTAFADSQTCPQRNVYIYIKWGSYPVFSPDNSSYPPNFYPDLSSGSIETWTTTTFEPKSGNVVTIYGPRPGDWFVAAYLAPWNEDVHQEGFGHKCRYSLGSVALWSETNNLLNIPLNHQLVVKTSETISYYKVYIPMETWKFKVDVWGCNLTLKSAPRNVNSNNNVCIKNLELKVHSLPRLNHTSKSSPVNLSSSIDSHTFIESSPHQDSWYYLMVVSSSPINFNVKVTVIDCPVRSIEDVYIRQYLGTSKDQSKGVNQLVNLQRAYLLEADSLNSCYARYQLVRIKDPQTFSRSYMLRGREWLTSWLVLTDKNPVVMQFDVLPLIDVGGTLDIELHMELDQSLIKQNVSVGICVRRGRIPKRLEDNEDYQDCKDGRRMELRSTTEKRSNVSLLVPYPQPDTWYIGLEAICYYYFDRSPVRCKIEEILVFAKVKLRACAFEGNREKSCGEYGVCQDVHRGYLYYSACKCLAKRRGWACTDDSQAVSELTSLVSTLWLTLSNLFFVPAVWLAFARSYPTEGFVYASTMIFSGLYHACDQGQYCFAKYEVLQYCDFLTGMLSFWVTLVSMAAGLSEKYKSVLRMLGVVIIAFEVESDKTGFLSNALPLILGTSVPLLWYCYSCCKVRRIIYPSFNWTFLSLLPGLGLVGLGVLLFGTVETESNYQYVHSCWHVIIATSLVFLIPPDKTEESSPKEESSSSFRHRTTAN